MKLYDSIIVYVTLNMRTVEHVTMGLIKNIFFHRFYFQASDLFLLIKTISKVMILYLFTSRQSEIETSQT